MLTKKDSPKKDSPKNDAKAAKGQKSASPASAASPYAVAKAPTQQPAKTYTTSAQTIKSTNHAAEILTPSDRKAQKTRIILKYDAGYNNQLYIRGKGANLNWEKGQPLKNVKADEWMWETDAHFSQCEFKVLINDRVYENGDNHLLNCGSSVIYTPHFY